MRPIGWRTVVSAGQTTSAIGASSKPTTESCSGTAIFLAWATAITAAAMSSLLATMAVGGSGRSSSRRAQDSPEAYENEPCSTRSSGKARPRSRSNEEKPSKRSRAAACQGSPLMKPMRRWPSPVRCSVSSRAAPKSSMRTWGEMSESMSGAMRT